MADLSKYGNLFSGQFTPQSTPAAMFGDSGSSAAPRIDYLQNGDTFWQAVENYSPGSGTIWMATQKPGGDKLDRVKAEFKIGPDGSYVPTGEVQEYREDPTWKQGVGIAGVLAGAGAAGLFGDVAASLNAGGAAGGTTGGAATGGSGLLGGSVPTGAGTAGVGAGELGSGMYGVGTAGGFAAPELATGLGTGFAGTAPMVGTLPAITPWGVGSGITSGLASGAAATAGSNAVSNGLLADAGMAGGAAAGGAAGGAAAGGVGSTVASLLKDYPWLVPLLAGGAGYLDAKNQPDRAGEAPAHIRGFLDTHMVNGPKSPWMRY